MAMGKIKIYMILHISLKSLKTKLKILFKKERLGTRCWIQQYNVWCCLFTTPVSLMSVTMGKTQGKEAGDSASGSVALVVSSGF